MRAGRRTVTDPGSRMNGAKGGNSPLLRGMAADKLRHLYATVENGVTELDDILKDRVATLKTDRDRAKEALDRIKVLPKAHMFDAQAIDRFGTLMRENITSGPISVPQGLH